MTRESNVCLALLVIVIILCVASTLDLFYKKPCGCLTPCTCRTPCNNTPVESIVDINRPYGNNSMPGDNSVYDEDIHHSELIKELALEKTVKESHEAFVKEASGRTSTASGDIMTDHENILNPRQGFRGLNTAVSHTPYARQVPSDTYDEFPEYKPACF